MGNGPFKDDPGAWREARGRTMRAAQAAGVHMRRARAARTTPPYGRLRAAGLKSKPKCPPVTKERLLAAIPGTCGVISRICRKLDCRYTTYWNRMDRWPQETRDEVLAAIAAEKERFVDVAESTVLRSMRQTDDKKTALSAGKFVLTTRGQHRGWAKTIKVEGGSSPIEVRHSGVVDVASLDLPLEVRRLILERFEAASATVLAPAAPRRITIRRREAPR